MQLAVRLTAAPAASSAAFQASNHLSRVAVEEAQLRRIEADVVRVSGLGSSGKSSSDSSSSSSASSSNHHLLSQSQLDAAVSKFSGSKVAAAKGLSDALETLGKLRQEERDLHKELGQVLGKIAGMNIITSMNIGVPDGMGGDEMEVAITRPVGGKAFAKVVKGEDSDAAAVESSASNREEYLRKQSPPFASHEQALGSDGLGGSPRPFSQESAEPLLAGGKVADGMVSKVNGDDGLGGRIHPAAAAVTNGGPKNAAFRLHDQRMDGIGGSGKHLFHRRSNKHTAKILVMKKVLRNDGIGGDHRYREALNLKKVPRNRMRSWVRDCGDGLGGTAVWCHRVFSAAAGAKGSSSSASAVRASLKAALMAHDTAAKERAGFVSHHRKSGAPGGSAQTSGSGTNVDDNQGDDDDENGDSNLGVEFSDFDRASGGGGNLAGGQGYRDDGDRVSDFDGEGSGGGANFAGGRNSDGSDGSFSGDAMNYNSEGEAEAHGVAQEEQTSSDNSGSAAEFQDQQESQDTTSQDQPSTSVDITSNSKGDSSEVNS
jgi:hypothetical protein